MANKKNIFVSLIIFLTFSIFNSVYAEDTFSIWDREVDDSDYKITEWIEITWSTEFSWHNKVNWDVIITKWNLSNSGWNLIINWNVILNECDVNWWWVEVYWCEERKILCRYD